MIKKTRLKKKKKIELIFWRFKRDKTAWVLPVAHASIKGDPSPDENIGMSLENIQNFILLKSSRFYIFK